MRGALRVLCVLNALFQVIVGALCVLSPGAAAHLFQFGDTGTSTAALTRMFGGLLAGSGLLSALVARDPDRNPDLPLLLAAGCVVNCVADGVLVASGEMLFAQVAGAVILQAIVAALCIGYVARRGR